MNNHAMLWDRRTTAVFEMHPDALTADRYGEDYRNWLRQRHPFPIYMHEADPAIPSSVTYPRTELINLHKGNQEIYNFHSVTPTYALALALDMGYRRVELYGIDMEKEPWQAHRDGLFFWIGFLLAKGIEIHTPDTSPLLSEALYPFTAPRKVAAI